LRADGKRVRKGRRSEIVRYLSNNNCLRLMRRPVPAISAVDKTGERAEIIPSALKQNA
jgi:hypothetical protein